MSDFGDGFPRLSGRSSFSNKRQENFECLNSLYRSVYTRRVERELRSLPQVVIRQTLDVIFEQLRHNPRPHGKVESRYKGETTMSEQKAFLEKIHIKNFLSLRNVTLPLNL